MTRNDFKENISQAIDEMKNEQGDSFDLSKINLAELERRTGISRSKLMPNKWCEFFNEDESLKCALDRIFDDVVVYMIQGESYRGKNLEIYSITTSANRNK